MTLRELLKDVKFREKTDTALLEKTVTGVTADSRRVGPGMVFLAMKGLHRNGHDFVTGVAERGGIPVVTDEVTIPAVYVDDTRELLGVLCAAFEGNPSRSMKLVGVTGTNAKTTVSTVIQEILEHAGRKTGLVGTVQYRFGEVSLHADYTTPTPEELQALLHRMRDAGCQYVSMEVGSQALDQRRTAGLQFEVGIFTNLTQDHLDYHHTMEEYFKAKLRLFDQSKTAVLNLDDPTIRTMVGKLPCKTMTYSVKDDAADFTAKNIRTFSDRVEFELLHENIISRMVFPMPGLFSVSNALAACAACLQLGLSVEQVTEGLAAAHGVRGRMEVLPVDTDFTVLCDYAHTPDALENLLSTVKGFAKGRVITVFGASGNRDTTKRIPMGQAVSRYTDVAVITSDNPRDDDPVEIIEQVKQGMDPNIPTWCFPERTDAIRFAVDYAEKDDVVVLAGKGHEDYQMMHGCTVYFSEREIVLDAVAKRKERE